MKLILASNSPRRRDILTEAGYTFTVAVSGYKEDGCGDPLRIAVNNAFGKAKSVFDALNDKKEEVVLGADTVVVCDGESLGKPTNREDAERMLKKLSGKTHSVITGYCVISENGIVTGEVKTEVTFNALTESVINAYLDSGLYRDKAGSYGIQDGYGLVKKYDGSLYNVIGLPVEEINSVLKKFS